jgi:hypothetical protein
VPFKRNLNRITSQIQGSLSPKGYGNPELNSENESDKCEETRGFAPRVGDGIVQAL